jgi:hypothetical protein
VPAVRDRVLLLHGIARSPASLANARTAAGEMADHAVPHATHTFMARNARVLSLTIRFLWYGRFGAEG